MASHFHQYKSAILSPPPNELGVSCISVRLFSVSLVILSTTIHVYCLVNPKFVLYQPRGNQSKRFGLRGFVLSKSIDRSCQFLGYYSIIIR